MPGFSEAILFASLQLHHCRANERISDRNRIKFRQCMEFPDVKTCDLPNYHI